jgi:signal transduction histidine kinase
MRALSTGFALLVAILVVSVLGGSALRSPAEVIVTQVIALAVVPIIYVSLAPPRLLRRLWRMVEEDKLRAAIQGLLNFSPSRQALAERAVEWAIRLVGAEAAFIVDAQEKVMASRGVGEARIAEILEHKVEGGVIQSAIDGTSAMLVPLTLSEGRGYLGVVAGPFTPLFGSDEISQLTGYASSVTAGLERTKVTERMAAIEKHKTQFLNLASHELRGPLTVIRGYGSMLESGLLGELNERGLRAAPVITAKILEMNDLIEQMIEAARLEDGALLIRPEEADLRELAEASVAAARLLADERHTVTFAAPNRPVMVRVDAGRIQTIITNLLSNAIKYSPSGGDVACAVTLRSGIARVAVKDSGVGIAEADLPILFTRFGRVPSPATNHLPGTGLGLYLGRQLARLHGGEVTVESTAGQGSTFTLHLPSAERPRAAERPQAASLAPGVTTVIS